MEDEQKQFKKDMEKIGVKVRKYHGRFFYHGWAVEAYNNKFPTIQDIIRATDVKLLWDNLGLDYIVYPK